MKVALITDTHFGVRSGNQLFLDNQKMFYEKIFFPTLEKENIKVVLHLGDIFDQRKQINLDVWYQTKEMFFDVLKENDIEFHAISGNHDVYYKNTNRVNGLDLLLREYENVHVNTKYPKHLKIGDTDFLMVPWITDDNREKCLDEINNSDADVVLGHFDIQGFQMRKGTVSDHGLDRNIFKKYHAVYSGHYHHGNSSGNVEYLGAPSEYDWSDSGCNRGFHIFDCTSMTKRFIINPYKMHIDIEYDQDIDESDLENIEIPEGSFIRIKAGSVENPHILENLVDKLSEKNSVAVTTKKLSEDVKNFDIEENASFEEIIEEYLKFSLNDDIYEKYSDVIKKKLNELQGKALKI